jgi:23S rRNA pseudouridine2605 synthase
MAEQIRLQKLIASAGICSRRVAEELIEQGRVVVNDEIVIELGRKVDPELDEVRVNGEKVNFRKDLVTIAVNKPVGIVSTMEDPEGRPTLFDLVGTKYGRVFHIGRLDTDSEGLILMSNDGDLAQLIAHPKGEIPKTYIATVNGKISVKAVNELLKGVELKDGFSKFDKANILAAGANESLIEVVLHSGKNRIVRRMFKEVGFKVTRLVRVQIGPIRIGELKTGKSRVLSDVEVGAIEAMANSGKKSTPHSVRQTTREREQHRFKF